MVYESDFYTTRRPYRATPNYSSYTVSSVVPSRQIRILPGIGKVHVVHSYDRIIPYIGHKRLTVVTSHQPHVFRVRPSVIIREIDRIQHKARPFVYFSPTSHYLNSEAKTYDPYYYSYNLPYYPSYLYNYPYYNKLWRELYWSHLYPKYPVHVWSKMFDDETRLIRAQTASLLKRVQAPVPRVHTNWPVAVTRYSYQPELTYPARVTSDDFVYRMLTPIRNVKQDIYNISHYHSEPLLRRFVGGGLACVKYAGDKAYSRRRNLTVQDIYAMQSDAVRSDIQLLSYYIKANKDRKALDCEKVPLSSTRPSRIFSPRKLMLEPSEDIKELREQRAERLATIRALEAAPVVEDTGARIKRATKQKEEERLAEERALAEENAKKQEQAKKEEAARKAELARQEALAAQAASERAAELERKAEQAKKEEEAKKAEEARIVKEKEEAARLAKEKAEEEARVAKQKAIEEARRAKEKEEEEKKQADLARQEEERQQLLRLEEIARQAEEEKEKELARQAAELAELARQESELADQARKEAELAELVKKEAELAEMEKQEKELAELDRKEREIAEEAKYAEELEESKKEAEEVAAAEAAVSSDDASHSPAEEVASPEPEAESVPVVEEPVTPDVQPAQESATSVEEVEEEPEM